MKIDFFVALVGKQAMETDLFVLCVHLQVMEIGFSVALVDE